MDCVWMHCYAKIAHSDWEGNCNSGRAITVYRKRNLPLLPSPALRYHFSCSIRITRRILSGQRPFCKKDNLLAKGKSFLIEFRLKQEENFCSSRLCREFVVVWPYKALYNRKAKKEKKNHHKEKRRRRKKQKRKGGKEAAARRKTRGTTPSSHRCRYTHCLFTSLWAFCHG